jgi:hypothetical protein
VTRSRRRQTARPTYAPMLAVLAIGAALWVFWQALPWLIAATVLVTACRRWQLHRRALAWSRGPAPARPPHVVQGQVITDTEDDLRRQVAKLEQDAARHEQLVDDLEDAAGRPIDAVIETYRHIQKQYGPAGVGKPGRRP